MRNFILILALLFSASSCDALLQIAQESSSQMEPSESEINRGIKEALEVGIRNAVSRSSKENGFYNNPLIKIPFPPEAERAAKTLGDLGMGNLVDQFVETLNHGAEQASAKASPIFVDAIRSMTLQDVYGIWRGDANAATVYLRSKTEAQLKLAFKPVIDQAIQKVELTKYWQPIASTYNKIPFVTPVNPDLSDYVMQETLNGLFVLLAEEEAKIRQDPAARVSAILQRVFGWKS
ncbi:DUF4197 domain-containing protein [Croceimicrobium hydrocarbonivorans]|uniref:DUF4197 domain-containing protein n=1 Tax=Croceimicrobium hydrocarbonivorans TaxID=2761580 RepID=A0A7H0VCR1_9FLAO|nr:DUF4197 domain-containing protein [Croceimicrobium hydrocarbonivorans]QNR23509.1 DUF4197 domain-containing protein [Croceimicrobium hydrocarbonivorans]